MIGHNLAHDGSMMVSLVKGSTTMVVVAMPTIFHLKPNVAGNVLVTYVKVKQKRKRKI